MASISTEKSSGRRTVQFVEDDGARRSIRLGKVTKSQAEQTKRHIESMLSAKLAGAALDRQTAIWLSEAGGVMHDKLARAGLCELRDTFKLVEADEQAKLTLGEFLKQ